MTIRLGIIGAGTIGEIHANAAKAAKQTVAGFADVDTSRAQALAKQFSGATVTNDPQTLLDDASIDAIVVGVPNCWHKELAIAAMRAGKDVLLEKPMGMNAAECQEINDTAKSTGQILQIGMANRFTSVGQSAKQFIGSGDLGEIYHAKAHLYRRRGVPGLGGWFTTKEFSGGGPLIDIGVHVVDLACWLMGFPKPQRVSGKVYSYFGKRMQDYVYEDMWAGPPKLDGVCDVEDSAHALIHFEGGSTLDLNVSWAINMPTNNMQGNGMMGFFGDRGGVTFELSGDHLDIATEQHGRNVDTRVILSETDPFQTQATDFAESVETRKSPCATGKQGQIVQSILDAVYESSETNQEIACG